jgi:hypothetical protein
VTIASRMITYPMVITRKSLCSNAWSTPAASNSAPEICTNVVMR